MTDILTVTLFEALPELNVLNQRNIQLMKDKQVLIYVLVGVILGGTIYFVYQENKKRKRKNENDHKKPR